MIDVFCFLQGLYPINYLRNVALNNSVTDYVFLSDVDFIPVPGLHAYLQQNIEKGLLAKKDVSTHTNLTRNLSVGGVPTTPSWPCTSSQGGRVSRTIGDLLFLPVMG